MKPEVQNRNEQNSEGPSKNPQSKYMNKNHVCEYCNTEFPTDIGVSNFMIHVKSCELQQSKGTRGRKPKKDSQKSECIFEKVNTDESFTTFVWAKNAKREIQPEVLSLEQTEIAKQKFQEKYSWFRAKLEKLRINWAEGSDTINVSRDNILLDSLNELKKVDIHKEIKIKLGDQKINDAGGLLREWMHLIVKQLFDTAIGIFNIATDTDDVMYCLNWDEEIDMQYSRQILKLFGIVIGKALFERISINSCLTRTILRLLSGNPLKLHDVYGHDRQLYKSWNYVLQAENCEQEPMHFTYIKNVGGILEQLQLCPDGKNTKVTNQNRSLFINLSTDIIFAEKVHRSIEFIRMGISSVFQPSLLQIFEPYEIEMMLYGVPFIDLVDWEQNTEYTLPYSKTHKVIKWFWKIMSQFDQQKLSKILQFCTGSARTPINGFRKLQSNRGNYSKFRIVSSKYEETNPYPKGYTCFNRLQLPFYPDKDTLQTYLSAVSSSNLEGVFGLE